MPTLQLIIRVCIFVLAMLGHFVGDYLLQNAWMATGKSKPGWPGHFACSVHVLLYTLAIAVFTGIWNPWFLLVVATPHWLIDRTSFAWTFLRFKNGYSEREVWTKAPVCAQPAPDLLERNVWKTSFAAFVYVVNDNTMHWVCLWLTILYFVR